MARVADSCADPLLHCEVLPSWSLPENIPFQNVVARKPSRQELCGCLGEVTAGVAVGLPGLAAACWRRVGK